MGQPLYLLDRRRGCVTGKLKWYYQTVPSDAWDLDSVGGFIMADVQIEGKTRKVIMQAPKSGVFYILDRTNGQFISAEPFVPVNWVTGFDKKNNGKPIINQDAYYDQTNSVRSIRAAAARTTGRRCPTTRTPAWSIFRTVPAPTPSTPRRNPIPRPGGGAHGLGRGGQDKKTTPMPIWGPDAATVGRGGLQARDPKTNTIKWVKQGRGSGIDRRHDDHGQQPCVPDCGQYAIRLQGGYGRRTSGAAV